MRELAKGGRLELTAILDRLTPADVDQWVALREIEPDPMRRIADILTRGFALLAQCWGWKGNPDLLDPEKDEEGKDPAHEAPLLSPTQAAAAWSVIAASLPGKMTHG
jgi:hypothetical protein